MSDTKDIPTPRTDAAKSPADNDDIGEMVVYPEKMADIERELAAMTAQRDALREAGDRLAKAAGELSDISNESEGITGWHLNGDVLPWGQCEPLGDTQEALAAWSKLTK